MQIRLAVRDWDVITPLLLGDISAEGIDLQVERVETLPEDFTKGTRFDAAEMSMSRYCLARARGDQSVVGIPHFIMRAFRHRCIVTSKQSGLTKISDLKGRRIGLAGWQDSGNTWTRAILRAEGIGIEDAQWRISRLLPDHPIIDRLAGFGRPGVIEPLPGDMPLLPMLEAGAIDAVFMPFMPPGFFAAASPFRQLVQDFRAAEVGYFKAVGYVPGIHLIGLRADIAKAHPGAAQAISTALDKSTAIWMDKRLRYADTTPWLLDELRHMAESLPEGWDRNGLAANERMIADFCTELTAQGLTNVALTPAQLFPDQPR